MLLVPKMKQEQISDLRRSRLHWSATAVQLTLLGLLSACGGGTPTEPSVGSAAGVTNEAPMVGPSSSAAQLSYDANYSIGFAQAVAAGVEDAPEKATSRVVTITSTDSTGAVPTTDSANSVVLVAADGTKGAGTGGSGAESGKDTANPTTDIEVIGSPTDQPLPEIPITELPGTDPEPPVTDVELPIIDPEPPVTDEESPIIDPEPPVTDEESPIIDPEPPVTDEESPITDPEPPVTDAEPPTTDPDPITTDSEPPVTDSGTPTSPTIEEPTEPVGSATATMFFSSTTEGFNGEVLSESIRVTWPVDPDARGYNVYRQAEFVTSVFTEEYIDEDVYDGNYYYEIQAFDNSDTLYYVATGLTVKATTIGTTDPDAPVPNTQLLEGYDLVFGDEFTGSTLDGTKWNTSYLWGTELIINSEEQYYVDILNDPEFGFNPFTFDGDNLTINSIPTPSELAGKSLNQPYLSGVITSYDAFKFTYGYVETRAKVTHGRGYWPAFWLLNAYYVDDMPEIDIMEFIGHNQDVVYHTYHYYDSAGDLRSTPSQPTPGVDYTADFHTYAVEWKPGTIIFYINNIEVHRVVDSKVSQQEMYVIANTALGGWWAGSPDNTTPFPGEFIIDYIRVYQKSQPYDDNLLDDGITQVPYADQIFGTSSPSHRPSIEDWPEGYPSGL
jgi:beta-glucanase (GH16 family)